MVRGWVRLEVMVVRTREVSVEVVMWAGSGYIWGMIKYGLPESASHLQVCQ